MSKLKKQKSQSVEQEQRSSGPSDVSLLKLIADTPVCILKPRCFFVSWHGVLTLCLNGWPEPIFILKKIIQKQFPTLKEEYFGDTFFSFLLFFCSFFKIKKQTKYNKKPRNKMAQNNIGSN